MAASTLGAGDWAGYMFDHALSEKVTGIDHGISQENIKIIDGVADK